MVCAGRGGGWGRELRGEDERLQWLGADLKERGHSTEQAGASGVGLRCVRRGCVAPMASAEPAAQRVLEDLRAVQSVDDALPGECAGEPPPARPEQSDAESDASGSGLARLSPVVDVAPEEYVYIVSTTARAQRKCLHMADGCYRARSHMFAEYELYAALPPPASYTSVCKVCWRTSDQAMALSASADAGSEGDSDSSSSSVSLS